MRATVERRSVDLSGSPELVVVYLGFRVTRPRGVVTLLGLGSGLRAIVRDRPDGLLAHEWMAYGLLHIGMRQYWRDMEALERFTRSEPHRAWWRDFLKDDRGCGFWHESYRLKGGMEAIYINMPTPTGLGLFADERHPQGPFMSARQRLAA